MLSSVQHLICTWFQKDIESLPQDVVAYQDDLSLRVASTEKVLCHLDKEASKHTVASEGAIPTWVIALRQMVYILFRTEFELFKEATKQAL